MREIILGGRIGLVFQPIVSLDDRTAHHHEALLRPRLEGSVAPLVAQGLVTFAESSGLAQVLDSAVLDQVLAAARVRPAMSIGVNLSGRSLESPTFRASILARIRSGIIRPQRLLIELTETAQIENVREARSTITALRAAGVRVCLDDLGAGAAAFRYLRDFAVDFVKIDGAYVHGAAREERDRRLVAAMVQLAHALGARVIAEMVETEAQAMMMQALGIEFGQGWLFGRPTPLPLHA
jgi:EAL domain-containing protein (putative c-di-GMP-specific phosphodiesterase class I)